VNFGVVPFQPRTGRLKRILPKSKESAVEFQFCGEHDANNAGAISKFVSW
jgi:hypothetical protein